VEYGDALCTPSGRALCSMEAGSDGSVPADVVQHAPPSRLNKYDLVLLDEGSQVVLKNDNENIYIYIYIYI
jgi:hypothetical protein